ncbi:MAG: serine hydrolase [Actinomycetia bacterium]|nr:serine hydrolase [Actinomycetes bacterium]MCP4959832.1 serine hydrolase [Actinomycetes bacterium]
MRQVLLSIIVAGLLSASCSSPDAAPETGPTIDGEAATSPVRSQLGWFLSAFNADGPPTIGEVEANISDVFLQQVPPELFITSTIDFLSTYELPFRVVEAAEPGVEGLELEALLESVDGQQLILSMTVTSDEPHMIETLLIQPGETPEFPADATIESIDESLSGLAANSSLGLYDVTEGRCDPVHEIRPEDPIVLGSAFKLWVLAELAYRVSTGDASWDETFAVRDELKSSPDGQIYPMEAGTEVSLQEYAELMISISDNSATDHLIARLQRSDVEAAIRRIGVSDPSANTPLMSTAALFQLKYLASDPNAAEYRTLDEANKRRILDQIDDTILPSELDSENAEGVAVDQPRNLDLEWFATPHDMCLTMVHLDEFAVTPGLEPVAGILEMNPGAGIPFRRDHWPTIRFKGGSEAGVLAGVWWFENPLGRRYVLAGGLNDPNSTIDEPTAIFTLASTITLVE